MDEATLLQRVSSSGDKDAFVSLLRMHEPAARAVAFSVTRSPDRMEDVLQDAYLKAYRSIRSIEKAASFRAWLCSIVRRTAIDDIRKNSRVQTINGEDLVVAVDDVSETAELVARRLDVQSALGRLTEPQRSALLLIDGEQTSYADAAEVLGIPQGTVATRVRAARSLLKQLLDTKEELSNE